MPQRPGLLLLDLDDTEAVPCEVPVAQDASSVVPLFKRLGPMPPPVPQPDPLPKLLEAARREGFAAGEAAGRRATEASQEAAAAAALSAISAALTEAGAAARGLAAEAAEAVAGVTLAALGAALPSLAECCGEAEAAHFARHLLPALSEEPQVELHVAPSLAPLLAARLADAARLEVVADPTLAPGDADLHWRGGRAERRAAEARGAVLRLISELAERGGHMTTSGDLA